MRFLLPVLAACIPADYYYSCESDADCTDGTICEAVAIIDTEPVCTLECDTDFDCPSRAACIEGLCGPLYALK